MYKRYYIGCILFFVFTLMLMAQDVKVIAPSTVPLDRYFELKFLVENADVESISLPKLTDFERLSGPNVSRSQSFQFVNGKQSHSSSVTYTYILQPKALGKFTIAGADLIIKGKSIKARDVEIVVTKSEGSANSSGYNARQQQSARIPLRNVTEKDLFVKVNATRVNVFEQEAVELVYSVYSRLGVGLSQIALAKTPDFKNLIAHDVPVDASETRVEEIDGATYKVFDCSKYIIFPQQNGEIEVSPLTFECQIALSDPSMDVFDAFFNGGLVSKVVKRTTKPLKLSVAALPEPKPNDFCGGVGSFSVKAELLTSKLRVNEISTYRVTISGAGNLKLLLPPTLNFPETFDTYDVKITEDLNLSSNGHTGKVVYDYDFVPQTVGEFILPVSTISYFDAKDKEYKTLNLPATKFNVKPALANTSNSRDEASLRNKDIRPIHQGTVKIIDLDDFIEWGTFSYFLWHIFLLVITAVGIYCCRRYKLRLSDKANYLKSRSGKRVQKRLAKVKSMLQTKDEFYQELLLALQEYLIERFGFSKSELNKSDIISKLTAAGFSNELVDGYVGVMEKCEFARYSPNLDSTQNQDLFNKACDIIGQFEKK